MKQTSRKEALKIARFIGCSGAHQDEKGNWLPCSSTEKLREISTEAESSKYVSEAKSEEKKKNRGTRRRFVAAGYEKLGERGVLGIEGIPGTGIVSAKASIITRARPRKGDPDVYEDPDSARLRARALGCIGIARRETPDGDYVWTPCTNVSDFRRQTGQSHLGQRDDIRRFRRRLMQVGSSEYGRSGKEDFKDFLETKGLRSIINMPTVGRRFGRSLSPSVRRRCKSTNYRDGDGDGFICNPVTGKDDLPVVNGNSAAANLLKGIKADEKGWKEKWKKAHARGNPPKFGDKKIDDLIPNLVNRGFIVTMDGNTLKIKPPPSFRRQYLAKAALERRDIDPIALDRIGYHKIHEGNDPNRPIINITGDLLDLFGYDAVNDVVYSPYFDNPNSYAKIKNGIPREFAYAVVTENENTYLTDSANVKSVKSLKKEALATLMKHREQLNEEQKKQRLLALTEEFKKLGYHDKDKDRDIMSDTEWLDPVIDHFQYSDLGGEEIAQILNFDSKNLQKAFDQLGLSWRPSPILEAIREDERQRIRSEELSKIASDRRYKLPKLERLNLGKKGDAPTSEEFIEYLKFVAWQQQIWSDSEDMKKVKDNQSLKIPNDIIFKILKEPGNARLRELHEQFRKKVQIPGGFQWSFYEGIVKNNAADIIQNNRVPNVLRPMIDAIRRTPDPKSERYTDADFIKALSILSRANSAADAERQLKQAGLRPLLEKLNTKFGAFPPITRLLADLNQQPRGPRVNPGPRRQAVKSIQSITHIVPFSFKVGNSKSIPELSETIIAALAEKVSTHNDQMRSAEKDNWSMATLNKLKTVYARGLAAYQQSGPKNVPSNQWAMARVNAFLRILKSGQPTNKKYVTDNDLLHEDHPWKTRQVREKTRIDTEAFDIKAFPFRRLGNALRNLRGNAGGGRGGGKIRKRFAAFDRFARDADNDGLVQEGTTAERAAKPDSEFSKFAELLNRVKDPGGGFTYSMSNMDDVRSGWAIARKGKGIRLSADKVFDKNGDVTQDGIDHLHAFMLLHQDVFNQPPDNKRRIALGAWHNDEDGQIYFDVTDVYSKDFMDADQAKVEGRKQNQIAITDLDELHAAINNNDWDNRTPFLEGGGNGGDLIPQDQYDRFLKGVRDWRAGKTSPQMKPKRMRRAGNDDKRVDIADDRVAMMIAAPIKDLAAYHKDKQRWDLVRALPSEERKRIADAYDKAPDLDASEIQEEAREAYEALVKEIDQQYNILIKELKIKIEFTDDDPYENYFEMRDDFIQNRRLKILKTSVTGGHPFMTDEQNDKFRAVHDAFGHLATGRGFDRHGEEAAYQAHKSMFGPLAVKAAATELRGQNAFLLDRGFFGPQKLVILPSDMRKFLLTLLASKQAGQSSSLNAQRDSDLDNAYTKTGSHHVSCGRTIRS